MKALSKIILAIVCTASFLCNFSVWAGKRFIYGIENVPKTVSAEDELYVQVGVFRIAGNALKLRAELLHTWHKPVVISKDKIGRYVVVMGPIRQSKVPQANVSKRLFKTFESRQASKKSRALKPSSLQKIPSTVLWKQQAFQKFELVNPVLGVGAGLVFPSIGKHIAVPNGSFYPVPYNVDILSLKSREKAMVDVFAGYRLAQNMRFLESIIGALRYQYFSERNVGRHVTQYALPQFDNYNWHWGVSANVLSLMARGEFSRWHRIAPYVDLGLGLSLNQTDRYTEAAHLGVTPRVSPAFMGQSTAQFAWYAGAGLNWQVTSAYFLSLGYLYEDLGSVRSGQGQANWSYESLSLHPYQTNTILLGVNYVFKTSDVPSKL